MMRKGYRIVYRKADGERRYSQEEIMQLLKEKYGE